MATISIKLDESIKFKVEIAKNTVLYLSYHHVCAYFDGDRGWRL